MHLENVVVDAADPQRLGRFWEAALAGERLTDEPGIFETRVGVEAGPWLDLCFQAVDDLPTVPPRLHLDLRGGARQAQEVQRLVGLGARPLDVGRSDVAWVVLADPEGNPCCVMPDTAASADTGPIVGLPLDSADPARDAPFWSWLTGWPEVVDADGAGTARLRHPSGRGPYLALCPQRTPKGEAKNRLHLDMRLEAGEDADDVEAAIAARGGRRLHPGWGELAWRTYADPSGNELCVLPASSSAATG